MAGNENLVTEMHLKHSNTTQVAGNSFLVCQCASGQNTFLNLVGVESLGVFEILSNL